MQQFFTTCKRLLSKKSTGIVFLVTAIIVKVVLQYISFSLLGDKSHQLLAAKNLLEGHGITINQFFLNDLSQEKFTPLVGWPPGYSLVMAPLLWLCNNDFITAAIVFDMLCVFPFFFYLIKLLNFFCLKPWLNNLFILFSGFFFYPITSSGCTNMIAVTCMMAGFYYLLLLMNNGKNNFRLVLLVSIFFFLAGLFRYNYIPVVFCCPVLLLVAGFINKNKQWIKASYQIGFLLILSLGGLLIFQHFYTGDIAYVNSRETGFFPENLLRMYPIVPASLSDVGVPVTVVSNFSGINYLTVAKVLNFIGFVLLLFLLFYGSYKLLKKGVILKKKEDYFLYMGMGISIAIAVLLAYMSLRNSAIIDPLRPPWTYVQEYRYYAFIIIFIQLLTVVFLFEKFEQKSRFWKRVAIVCATIMLAGSLHKVYYVSKLFFVQPIIHNPWSALAKTTEVLTLFKTVQDSYPGYEIIVAAQDGYVCDYAAFQNIKAIRWPSPEQLTKTITYSKPAKLLIGIPDYWLSRYTAMLNNPSLNFYGKIQHYYFYLLNLKVDEQ